MKYELKKGEINKLHDLNQELKNIYNEYYLTKDGYIFGDSKLNKGKHFGITEFIWYFDFPVIDNNAETLLKLIPQNIFTAVSKNKKNLQYIKVDEDHKVYLSGENLEEDILIGEFHSGINTIEELNNAKAFINSDMNGSYMENSMMLTKDSVEKLVGNEFINIAEDKYRTRITKEIAPGLKKSHVMYLFFFDNPDDKKLFHLGVKIERGSCISYHKYTCLYM